MLEKMKNLVIEEEGQGVAEYGLVLVGVVAVVAIAVGMLKTQITTLFTDILK